MSIKIKTARDMKEFFNSLTEEQLDLVVLFDTEAKEYDYHMAKIGSIYCEDQLEEFSHVGLHEE